MSLLDEFKQLEAEAQKSQASSSGGLLDEFRQLEAEATTLLNEFQQLETQAQGEAVQPPEAVAEGTAERPPRSIADNVTRQATQGVVDAGLGMVAGGADAFGGFVDIADPRNIKRNVARLLLARQRATEPRPFTPVSNLAEAFEAEKAHQANVRRKFPDLPEPTTLQPGDIPRAFADVSREWSDAAEKALDVDKEFAESIFGAITHAAGGLPVYLTAGLAGNTGKAMFFAASFNEAYEDDLETQQRQGVENPDREQAFINALPYGMVGMWLERLGIDNILAAAFPKKTATLTKREAMRRLGVATGSGALGEGTTEALQGLALDVLADDSDRQLWTADKLKQRMVEFLVGAVVGGGAGGAISAVTSTAEAVVQWDSEDSAATALQELRDRLNRARRQDEGSTEEEGGQERPAELEPEPVVEPDEGGQEVEPEVTPDEAPPSETVVPFEPVEDALDELTRIKRELDDPQPLEQVAPEEELELFPEVDPPGQTMIDPEELAVVELPVDALRLSEDVPQFKEGADSRTGVVEGEQLSGRYERLGTAPIVVWERENGDLEVITGRHRLDLARRTGEETIPAQVVREADGFTARDALTFDAESNIRDEKGTARDYAHYFRNRPDLTEEEARSRGLLSRAKGHAGWVLGRAAEDDLYTSFRNNQITEEKAVAIARAAPNQAGLQQAALRRAKDLAADELELYARNLAAVVDGRGLRGEQLGLFGDDDPALLEAEAIAKEAAKRLRQNKARILSAKGALRRPTAAAAMGVTFKDRAATEAEIARLEDMNRQLLNPSGELMQELRVSAGLETTAEPSAPPEGAEGQQVTQQEVALLPEELKGAKPRYGYGAKNFTLSFESDLDLAAYIVTQAKKGGKDSKRHAAYRSWLESQGLGAEDIAARGRQVRERIKAVAKRQPAGEIRVVDIDAAADELAGSPETPSETRPVRPLLAKEREFIRNLFARLKAANPDGYNQLQIEVLTPDQWRVRMPDAFQNRGMAYDFSRHAIVIKRGSRETEPGRLVGFLVHETGHFADDLILPPEVTQGAWARLTHEQRLSSWRQYLRDPDAQMDPQELLDNKAARREWVAFQFARVVRGESQVMELEGLPRDFVARLQAWLRDVREMVRGYITGGQDLADAELDRAILTALRYTDASLLPGTQQQQQGPMRAAATRSRGSAANRGGFLGTGGELGVAVDPENRSDADRMVLELPELVELARQLMGGQLPSIRRKMAGALGRFSFRHGGGSEAIQLRADIFDMVSPEEKQRLRAAANDYAVATVDPNKLPLGKSLAQVQQEVADAYYEDRLNEAYEEAIQRNPKVASKVLAHEIGHLIDYLPDKMIGGRGNILGRIASLKKYLMTTLAELPENQDQVLTRADRAKIRRAAEREVGPRPPKDEEAALGAWREAVSALYHEMIKEEIHARGLVTREEIHAELDGLTAWWYDSDGPTPYQAQGHERYADALSVLLNNPQALKERAPKFYRLWENWLENKPEVRKAYEAIQKDIRSGRNKAQRVKRLREGFAKADAEGLAMDPFVKGTRWGDIQDWLRVSFDRSLGAIYRRLDESPTAHRVRQSLGNLVYRATEHERFLLLLNRDVAGELSRNNLTWVDLGEYMFHKRVLNDRRNVANPHGWNPKASQERLAEMAETMGAEKLGVLAQAAQQYRKLYEETVLAKLREWRILDENLLDVLDERTFYATFAVTQGISQAKEESIEEAIDLAVGRGVGSKIYKQFGTLRDVANPATATMQKALSLISMAYREKAKADTVEMLMARGEAVEAEMRWDGRARTPVVIESDRVGTLQFLQDGKLHAYYVPRYVARAFEREGDPVLSTLNVALSQVTSPLKAMFTQLNYGFWPVAAARDLGSLAWQMPKGSFFRTGRYLPRAYRAARSSVVGNPNADALKAMRRQLLISRSNRDETKGAAADEFERTLLRYGVSPETWALTAERKFNRFARFWRWYTRQGEKAERMFKVAGMLYLDEKFPDMPEWKKQELVRERAGSPDFLQRPVMGAALDTFVGLYYNAIKEGVRSMAKTVREQPGQTAWNYSKYVLPLTGFMALAQSGLLRYLIGDDDAEELQEMYLAIPEYYKTNYLVIPLGWADRAQKKVTFASLPLFEGHRMLHGITWKTWGALSDQPGTGGDLQQVASFAGGQLPTSSPLVETMGAWWAYAVDGRNPYDAFRGREIVDSDRFEAGEGMGTMVQWTWNTLGGGVLKRFDEERLGEAPATTEEKLLDLPIVSNLVGRWIRVSDRGFQEQMQQAAEDVERDRARARLVGKEIIRKLLVQEDLDADEKQLLFDNEYVQDYVYRRLPEVSAQQSSPILRALERAKSREGQDAMLEALQQRN